MGNSLNVMYMEFGKNRELLPNNHSKTSHGEQRVNYEPEIKLGGNFDFVLNKDGINITRRDSKTGTILSTMTKKEFENGLGKRGKTYITEVEFIKLISQDVEVDRD